MKTLFVLILFAGIVSCAPSTANPTSSFVDIGGTSIAIAELTQAAAPVPTQTTAPVVEAEEAAAEPPDEEIAAQLERLGYNPDEGSLGWAWREPLKFVATTGNNPLSALSASDPIFANFVLSVDVAWSKEGDQGGFGGCGIALRAQDDFDGEGLAFWTRLEPLFSSWNLLHLDGNGNRSSLLGDGPIYEDGVYEEILSTTTNHYVLIADGANATVYANGREIGSAELPENLIEGQIAFYPWSGGGTYTCTFSNGWLWSLPD